MTSVDDTAAYSGADRYCDLILNGKEPVLRVHETANVLAFHHTRPSHPVHIVVVPKRHVASLTALEDADQELVIELFAVIREVAANVERETGACRVVTNLGTYQDSKHLHFHVVSGPAL